MCGDTTAGPYVPHVPHQTMVIIQLRVSNQSRGTYLALLTNQRPVFRSCDHSRPIRVGAHTWLQQASLHVCILHTPGNVCDISSAIVIHLPSMIFSRITTGIKYFTRTDQFRIQAISSVSVRFDNSFLIFPWPAPISSDSRPQVSLPD